jgi:hypothetical protein
VEEPGGFDLLAASVRADATDVRAFVSALATKLELSFPARCRVERSGFLAKKKRVRRIAVDLGDARYELEHDDGAVNARRSTVVRGIALKSEELSLEEWVDKLVAQLSVEAEQSERDREALERLIG